MHERATLRLDTGREIRVEVDPEDLDADEIFLRRTHDQDEPESDDLLAVIDAHLAVATRHPAGTTDRLLAEDRDRPV